MTGISDKAFNGCTALEKITLPDTLTAIGSEAFSGCTVLKEITIPDSVTEISEKTFNGCTALEKITLPDTLTTIGYEAFKGCTALKEITLPDTLTNIISRAFCDCTALKKVTIPADVAVGDNAFAGCADDLTLYGYTNSYADHYAFRYHINFVSLGEVVGPYLHYSITDNEATLEWYNGYKTDLIIPSTYKGVPVTALAYRAFKGKRITSITLPDTVKTIGSSAFENCTVLASITLPEGLEKINSNAFANCTALTEITIPEATTVDVDAFNGCSDALTIRGYTYSTAEDCAIEKGFQFESLGVAKDRSHYYQYTVEDGKATITKYTGRETEITIPATLGGAPVTEIGYGAFRGKPIRSITIPDTVTEIGFDAFADCESLSEIMLPDGLKYIGWSAFSGCTALTAITIPENTYMEPGVFDDTDTLTVFGYTYSYAYDATLNTKIHFVSLGEAKDKSHYYTYSVTGDGKATVTRYNGPEVDITIPATLGGYPVGALAEKAFSGVKQQPNSIVVPESVEKIGSYALNCNPKTITILSRNAEINYNYFGENTILRGYAGSTTETYAKNNNKNFIPIGMDYDADSPYRYSIYGEEVTINRYLGDDHDLTLPAELSGYPVTTISRLFDSNFDTEPYRLVIPDSVKKINNAALYGPKYADVTFYSKEISIEGLVFRKNEYPTYDFSDMMIHGYTGSDVDAYCTKYQLNFVPIGTERAEDPDFDYITYNGSAHILRYKGNNENVTVPRELGGFPVTEISNKRIDEGYYTSPDYLGAFENTNIKSVTLPDTVTEISRSAFEGCTQLEAITLSDSVTTISGHAFKDCTALESIHIPASVTAIYSYDDDYERSYLHAFEGCSGLKTITVDENNPVYDSRNNCNAIIYTEWNKLVQGCRNTIIPDTVTSIMGKAFKDCIGLTKITIPDSVDIISDYAFQNCTDLTYVKLPDSHYGEVLYYSTGAFKGCTGLEQVVVPPLIDVSDLRQNNVGVNYRWDNSLGKYVVEKNPDSKLTIYGYYGTSAEEYAVKYDFPFRMIAPSINDDVIIDAPEGKTYSVVEKATNDEASPGAASPDEKQPLPKGSIVMSAYDITLRDKTDEKPVQPDGPVTVRIRCDNPAIHVFRRETDGTLTDMNARYENGYLVFETDHFSVYLLVKLGAEVDLAICGDADGDGAVTSIDAAIIQRYCANMETGIPEATLMHGDVDRNGYLDIIDSTFIERWVAQMDVPFEIGEKCNYQLMIMASGL